MAVLSFAHEYRFDSKLQLSKFIADKLDLNLATLKFQYNAYSVLHDIINKKHHRYVYRVPLNGKLGAGEEMPTYLEKA